MLKIKSSKNKQINKQKGKIALKATCNLVRTRRDEYTNTRVQTHADFLCLLYRLPHCISYLFIHTMCTTYGYEYPRLYTVFFATNANVCGRAKEAH